MYPIGTIILLNEGKRKIMILNRGSLCKNEEGEINYFDYSGCIYPVGLDPQVPMIYFNEENIAQVVHEGYRDSEEQKYLKLYKEWEHSSQNPYPKGKVTGPLK